MKTLPVVVFLGFALLASSNASAQRPGYRRSPGIKFVHFKSTRPVSGEQNVPLKTSIYFQLGEAGRDEDEDERIDLHSINIRLAPQGGEAIDIVTTGQRVAPPATVKIAEQKGREYAVNVAIESGRELDADTTYSLQVTARSTTGAGIAERFTTCIFHTEPRPAMHSLAFGLDLTTRPLTWHGGFFTGFCKPSFNTSFDSRIESGEMMYKVHRKYPKAWSVERDWWITGMGREAEMMDGGLPNVVRELESRRIKAMETKPDGILLRVEDFFGHEQYGIPSSRTVSTDYHAGDEVLIAGGGKNARTQVVATDNAGHTVLVKPFAPAPNGWKLEYSEPLPKKEDPNRPGLFAKGGCYLMKFKPAGTPCYYWGRVDKEEDLVHKRFDRRIHVNLCDAPGDVSIDGGNFTTAKDLVEHHEAVRAITSHLIERYGDASLSFVWSVLNEPDLTGAFWRNGDWVELQRFYDYTVDGVLRAFEDHGYDSNRVFVGGLELGAPFGMNLRASEFLAHCSPTRPRLGQWVTGNTLASTLPYNAAYADRRLDGKRSKRVEKLCRASGGLGAPCDFVSVHCYNPSDVSAAKMIRMKEIALSIDPDYYKSLWVNTHEACLAWAQPPDAAISETYMGNGYFPGWCSDVASRLLHKAVEDPRYAYGESILTFWPWLASNFSGSNDVQRAVTVDRNGDGLGDHEEVVPTPTFHLLGLLNSMSDDYWTLPERQVGGQMLTGFASKTRRDLRMLLYSHNPLDYQSRSEATYDVAVDLKGTAWPRVRVDQYRFDKDNNSYYHLAMKLRDKPATATIMRPVRPGELREVLGKLRSARTAIQMKALKRMQQLGPAAMTTSSLAVVKRLSEGTNPQVKHEADVTMYLAFFGPRQVYTPQEMREVEKQAALRVTRTDFVKADANGIVHLKAPLAGNSVNFLVVRRAGLFGR